MATFSVSLFLLIALASAFNSSNLEWDGVGGPILGNSTDKTCILGNQRGCDTGVAEGLTLQIVAQLNRNGYSFSTLDSTWIRCYKPCVNQLQTSAANALASAAKAKNDYITLNSAYRSSAQQYLLYSWYQAGICGISLAARPGTSNHEGGRAIDTSYFNYWLSTLQQYGWVHSHPTNDPVHFDYTAASDLARQNLIAFQQLWNNNGGSTIATDGIYGPDTANALANAPCNGW